MGYVMVALVPVGLVLGPVGTLVLWRLRRDEPFLDMHGRQALDVFVTGLVVSGGLYLLGAALASTLLEWFAFSAAGLYFLLTVAGATLAARASRRRLPLLLPLLGRRA